MSQREWVEKDYYAELGVSSSATEEEIKKAYRKLARENHPDAHPGDKAAEDRFKRVSEAHNVLGDAAKRKEYDELKSMVGSGRFAGSGGYGGYGGRASGGSQNFSAEDFDIGDMFGGSQQEGGFSDLFGGLFGRGASGSGAGTPSSSSASRSSKKSKGSDVETTLTLTFREAAQGDTVPIRLTSPSPCLNCHGSGAKPGTSPKICGQCNGSGFRSRTQGAFAFSEPCSDCGGNGSIIDEPCGDCHGSGITNRARTVKVKVPAGVENGQRIRLAGQGEAGFRGAPSGDLYVTVTVGKDSVFGRNGNNLTVDYPVSITELMLGATISVPTLDGAVKLKVPPGTPDNTTMRVRGRGIAKKSATGDLLVTLRVAVPPAGTADAAARGLADALAGAGFDPRAGWGDSI